MASIFWLAPIRNLSLSLILLHTMGTVWPGRESWNVTGNTDIGSASWNHVNQDKGEGVAPEPGNRLQDCYFCPELKGKVSWRVTVRKGWGVIISDNWDLGGWLSLCILSPPLCCLFSTINCPSVFTILTINCPLCTACPNTNIIY